MYAGSKWAKGCNPAEFMKPNGYKTSSQTIQTIIKEEGLDSYEILRIDTYCDNLSVYDYESLFLQTLNCVKSEEWYNKHNNDTIPPAFGTEEFSELLFSKYGYKHNSQIPEIKQNKINSCLSKFEVKHYMQSPYTKEKSKRTVLLKFGVENISQSEKIKTLKCETNMKNSGVDHNGRIPVECPWCGKVGGILGMRENHFDKCKMPPDYIKPNIIIYTCTYCGLILKNKQNLSNHQPKCRSTPNYEDKRKIIICPHCNLESKSAINMKRYHFDYCKLKKLF
jgi:hypothetical protein